MSDPQRAQHIRRALDPVHAMIYFCPQAREEYAAIGVTDQGQAYFGSRSAAMGAVGPELVTATFYNFCPTAVREAIPAVWETVTPAQILAARYTAAGRALRVAFDAGGITDVEVSEAAGLARRAAVAATDDVVGRPLFAGHAGLPWPEDPVLVLWHAQTLLREHRGDGHVAALLVEGLAPLEALILHAASGDFPGLLLRATRRWPDEEWDAEVDALVAEGLITSGSDGDEEAAGAAGGAAGGGAAGGGAAGGGAAGGGAGRPVLTEAGHRRRQRVEDLTNQLAAPVYDVLDDDEAERLAALGERCSTAVVHAGLLGRRRPGAAPRG